MLAPNCITSLWDIMIEIDGHRFLEVRDMFASFNQNMMSLTAQGALAIVPISHQELMDAIEWFDQHARSLGLPLTIKSVANLKVAVTRFERVDYPGFIIRGEAFHVMKRYLDEVIRRSRDEYSTRTMLAVPYAASRFFEDGESHFGADVTAKFPASIYEMDEACKSFALRRHTAAVFHLMRLLENAIASLPMSLSIPDPIKPAQRNWGAILNSFRTELDARAAAKSWAKAADREFYEEIYLLLSGVKDAWRNATMHVENKYNEDEAEHVLTAVRLLMRKIARRVDEQGEPKV